MNRSRSERIRRIATFVLAPIVVVSIVAFARSRPVSVRTVRVDRGLVLREAIGTGTLESEKTLEVSFTIPGRLAEVRFDQGDVVHAGDVLAVLDADEESQRVAVARRSVSLASVGLERSAAEIRRAEVAAAAAATDRRRLETLFASGAVSEAELDAVRERHESAEAALAAARALRLEGAGSLSVARANLALDATREEKTVVRSPFEGLVVRRHLEPGSVIAPGAVVLTIASTQKVWARTWLDEAVLEGLGVGDAARVSPRAEPTRRQRARVDRIGVEADRETHEVLVDLELLERPRQWAFGMRVDGAVELERREGVLRVPRGACDEARGRCFVVSDGSIVEVEVELGLAGTEHVEVRRGLVEGQEVVLPPEDGAEVPVGRNVRRGRS